MPRWKICLNVKSWESGCLGAGTGYHGSMAGAVAAEAGEDRARTESRTPAVILLTE